MFDRPQARAAAGDLASRQHHPARRKSGLSSQTFVAM
jgi:hypothetical protein